MTLRLLLTLVVAGTLATHAQSDKRFGFFSIGDVKDRQFAIELPDGWIQIPSTDGNLRVADISQKHAVIFAFLYSTTLDCDRLVAAGELSLSQQKAADGHTLRVELTPRSQHLPPAFSQTMLRIPADKTISACAQADSLHMTATIGNIADDADLDVFKPVLSYVESKLAGYSQTAVMPLKRPVPIVSDAPGSVWSPLPPPPPPPAGVIGGIVGSPSTTGTPDAPKVRLPAESMKKYKVSGALPMYPAVAKAARISGAVEFAATIATDGTVQNLILVSGPPMLVNAAIDAVKTWRYRPYLLEGKARPVDTRITINFNLNGISE